MSKPSQTTDGAKAYDRVCRGIQSDHFKFMMSSIDVKKGWKILDVGCGTGCDTTSLAAMVGEEGEVVGIDPIAERIEVARESYKKDHLKFHVAFGNEACSFGKEFDLVVSCVVFHWIPTCEKPATFRNIAECLKFGGEFVFVTGRRIEGTKFSKLLKFMSKDTTEYLHQNLYCETRDIFGRNRCAEWVCRSGGERMSPFQHRWND